MESKAFKVYSKMNNVPLRVIPGHFATNHSHVNYYLDMTTIRARQSEAKQAAQALVSQHLFDTAVDTICCLDGTEVIGAYLADKLTEAGILSKNAHQTIYVTTPEFNSNSQMIFRENIQPMIQGKNVILLMASVTTGLTINKGVECIQYYGGILQGISSIFSAVDQVDGVHINAVFKKEDIPDYQSYRYQECPFCKNNQKIDALVNGFGYSKI